MVQPIVQLMAHSLGSTMESPSDNILPISRGVSLHMSELSYRTSRSSGPGGQNVNKVESKVELLWDVANSPSLSDYHKSLVFNRLASHVGADGVLRLISQESRSQHQNRATAVTRLVTLLQAALKPVRVRRATRPTHGSKQRRLEGKSIRSEVKQRRSQRPE